MTGANLIGMATALVLVAGPLLLGLAGWVNARRRSSEARPLAAASWNGRLTILSALLYTLAFNLTFFIQELFLVVPKALTPGLRPTLFHNNHAWDGENTLAHLFQGTGALAILLTGIVCALLLRSLRGGSAALRLFLIWMVYSGCFMALPQVVIGAVSPQSDVGMAMAYLGLGTTTRTVLALVALAAIPPIALRLGELLLERAGGRDDVSNAGARSRFMFRVATLPSMLAILLIIPFRVPREWIEVVMVPVVVTVIGVAWIQAGAWRMSGVKVEGEATVGSIAWPLGAVLFLLLLFQLVLRPGIRFY